MLKKETIIYFVSNSLLYSLMFFVILFSIFHGVLSIKFGYFHLNLPNVFLEIEKKTAIILAILSTLIGVTLVIINLIQKKGKITLTKNEIELIPRTENRIYSSLYFLINIEFFRKFIYKLICYIRNLPIFFDVNNKIFITLTVDLSFVALMLYIYIYIKIFIDPNFLDVLRYLLFLNVNNVGGLDHTLLYYFLSIVVSMVLHELFHVIGALFPTEKKEKYVFFSAGIGVFLFVPVAYVILLKKRKKFVEAVDNLNMVYFGVVANAILTLISLICILFLNKNHLFLSYLLINNIMLLMSNLFPIMKGVDGYHLIQNKEKYIFFINDLTFIFLNSLNFIVLIYYLYNIDFKLLSLFLLEAFQLATFLFLGKYFFKEEYMKKLVVEKEKIFLDEKTKELLFEKMKYQLINNVDYDNKEIDLPLVKLKGNVLHIYNLTKRTKAYNYLSLLLVITATLISFFTLKGNMIKILLVSTTLTGVISYIFKNKVYLPSVEETKIQKIIKEII